MLDTTHVWGAQVVPFFSPIVTAQVAGEAWERDAYFRLRATIFADEQRLFDTTDVDTYDAHATPIVALSHSGGMPDEVIGVVRIYRASDTDATWFGGRLGVSPAYRSRRVVGTSLICAAVSTAHAWGCRRFLATIQMQNVRYFEQHAFWPVERVEVCGRPHQLMQADLTAYPPCVADARRPVDAEAAGALFRRARAA